MTERLPRTTPRGRRTAAVIVALPLVMLLSIWLWFIRMPGSSYDGHVSGAFSGELERHVTVLAGDIGVRNHDRPEALERAAEYIVKDLIDGEMTVKRLDFDHAMQTFSNIEAERRGGELPDEIVVVGAHYDSAGDAPGANDNATGVAALLVLADRFREAAPRRTLRFVAFANEEPPHFQTSGMGSLIYARLCAERDDDVVAMLSLETMGYFDDTPGSQAYPFPLSMFYPDVGNFIGFVGDLSSRALVHDAITAFREVAKIPSEGAALPSGIPGVGWSDHWAFWQAGFPAVMITDTAPFRYPHYHETSDTPDKVDFERLAVVVDGLEHVVRHLVTR